MISCLIVAKSPAGKLALEKHREEKKRQPPHARLMYKSMFVERVTCPDPYTLEIGVKNKGVGAAIHNDDFKVQIRRAMLANGASEGVDYSLEVK